MAVWWASVLNGQAVTGLKVTGEVRDCYGLPSPSFSATGWVRLPSAVLAAGSPPWPLLRLRLRVAQGGCYARVANGVVREASRKERELVNSMMEVRVYRAARARAPRHTSLHILSSSAHLGKLVP